MNFKDQLEKDLDVFINTSEFGEKVTIDGDLINVVIDNDKLKELKLKNGGEGLVSSELLFLVKITEMPFKPLVGQNIMFNEKFYFIGYVSEDKGLYTITLVGSES